MEPTVEELAGKAAGYFKAGYNCAESVLMAMQEGWRTGEPDPLPATGFGAGMGRRGSVCGALSGGIMAIGLKYGRRKPEDDKEQAYRLAHEFYTGFEREFGSALCRELTDCDLTTTAGQEKFKELNLSRKCTGIVENAVRLLLSLPVR